MRVDQLAVVGFRKERFAHRPLVAHRKFAERRQRRGLRLFGARCGPYDIVGAAARLGVERPVAVGDQHHLLFEPFGLVDGHDLDRRFALVDAERACGPLLLPPVEEERNVGHAPRREADDLFVNGLQIGRFAAPAVESVAHDQLLESLFGRQQADRAQEIGLLRRQLRVERPSQVAVVDGFANRILLFDRQAECRRDEAAHGSTADDERLLRHDVEPVARIVVAPFEIEQLFGHACAVVASPHENDDLLGTYPSLRLCLQGRCVCDA